MKIELGIFAGRLYIDFGEYSPLVKYLEVLGGTDENSDMQSKSKFFTTNPIGFLLEWLALRRKAQDIIHTPMGSICQGRLLHENHPFFVSRGADAREIVAPTVSCRRTADNWDGPEDRDSEMEDDWDAIGQQE